MDFEYYRTKITEQKAFAIASDWGQGRSAFGGLTAALVLTHIEQNTALEGRDLRTINIHFCGAVILEQIFVVPGMGLLLLEAVFQRDYPVVSGVFLVVGVGVLLINLVVDLSYGWLDPKVRHD